ARHVFNRIREGVVAHDPYFECKTDALGKLGFSSYQKCTTAVRMLAYGIPGDLVDEYVRMSVTTCLMSMYKFCQAMIEVFGLEYLRQPTAADTERLLATNAARGFPGMLGSIDCMHWEWKDCPFAWQGQYKGHVNECIVILEAVASQDLWIWHSFFGMAGSHNDINVLQRSPVFARLAEGQSPPVNFEINGHQYNKGYYLADGIYPQWSTFVKTISKPQGEKRKRFAQMQESARKDVERAFGVLQSRWGIVRYPALSWDERKLWEVMTACVIMHNMIVEDERDHSIFDQGFDYQGDNVEPLHQEPATFDLQFHRELRDWHTHVNLQNDLVEHVWGHIGNR
uniref:DDE Tnp4 domain-containing protein n=1 Tax=Aegilops tauschii subsp. strangulata TaxID=200361 RepID=A0A453FL39_AEGTS